MLRTCILVLAGLCPISLSAQTVLTCKLDNGWDGGILTIDRSTNTVTHGQSGPYQIVQEDEDLVTILARSDGQIGGAIWILRKSDGRHWRALVHNSCTDTSCTDTEVSTMTLTGYCLRPVLE